jgi:hypothetical protein
MAAAKRRARSAAPRPPKGGAPISRAHRTQLNRLRRRAGELMLAYVGAGEATEKLKAAILKLKTDIDGWREESGRSDIRATKSRMRSNDEPDDWSCDSCEWIMVSMGRLCFLVGCDPDWNNCSYICITLPPDPNFPVS